jgi:hypothetical protein
MSIQDKLVTAIQNPDARMALMWEFGLSESEVSAWARNPPATVIDTLQAAGLDDSSTDDVVRKVLLLYGGVV